MPPQQTNLTSEPVRGAAGLRFDFATASVKSALSEKQAAGPPVASTRSDLGSLKDIGARLGNGAGATDCGAACAT